MHEDHKVQEPNFDGEAMKLPENSDVQPTITEERSSLIGGPILIVLVLLLVLILGGMYYWFATLNGTTEAVPPVPVERPTPEENNEPESTTAEAQVDTLLVTSPSDELSAIEADLEATNLDSLDAELQAIDAEIDAALAE